MRPDFIKSQYIVAQSLRSTLKISPYRLGAWLKTFGYTIDQVNKVAKDKREQVMLGWQTN